MFLSYDGIVFDVLFLNGWEQSAVYSEDEADFLFWHHIIDVTVILNPEVVAADVVPPVTSYPANQQIKSNLSQQYSNIAQRTQIAAQSGLISPTGVAPGKPIPSKIPLPSTYKPNTDSTIGNLINYQDIFIDENGDIAQKADGSPSYPPVTEIIPGIPYITELAVKTGPIQEVGATAWVQQEFIPSAGPTAYNATTTGTQGTAAEQQLYTAGSANAQTAQPGFLDRIQRIVQSTINTTTTVGTIVARSSVPAITATTVLSGPSKPTTTPPGATNPVTVAPPGFGGRQAPPHPSRRKRWPTNKNLPSTDIELRDRLQVSRRPLKVWVNSGPNGAPEYILNLPYEGCTVDASDGPKCSKMHFMAIHGNVTGVKRLTFECFEALPLFSERKNGRLREPNDPLVAGVFPVGLGEAAGAIGGIAGGLAANAFRRGLTETPPLISNRWTMKQVPDQETHLNTTVISGKAIFRMDILTKIGLTADQLRKYIMPPVAAGYVRRPPEVELGSLGNEVLYTIIDDQQMMNNPAGIRWGVHSVTILNQLDVKNPVDTTNKGGLPGT